MTTKSSTLKSEPPVALRLLRIKDIAERLQVSSRTIHRLVASGDLIVLRIGRSVRVSEGALQSLLTGRATD